MIKRYDIIKAKNLKEAKKKARKEWSFLGIVYVKVSKAATKTEQGHYAITVY